MPTTHRQPFLFLLVTLTTLLWAGSALAGPVSIVPGPVYIPAPPGDPLPSFEAMPSEAELALLFAASSTPWYEVIDTLEDIELGRGWWEENLAVTLHSIPAWRPEGWAYDAFIDFVHVPTGVQTGCWLKAGTDDIQCVDDAPPLSDYPVLLDNTGFLDFLFPLTFMDVIPGTQLGNSLRWDCMDLRLNSPQLPLVTGGGFLAGLGSGFLAASAGPGQAVVGAVGAWTGAAVMAAVAAEAGAGAALVLGLAAAVTAGTAAAVIGVLVVATAAATIAATVYVSGQALGPACPGCGDGIDPEELVCVVQVAADACLCAPPATPATGGTGNPHGGGKDDGDGSDAGSSGHDPGSHGSASGGMGGHVNHDLGYDTCTEWTDFNADADQCSGCWEEEPQDIEQATDSGFTTEGSAYCSVCTDGAQSHIGDTICVSGAVSPAR